MNKDSKEEPHFFNRAFVAKEVGVKPTTIKHWEREINYIDRHINRSRNGGKRLYSRANVEQFLEVKRLLEDERLSVEEVASYFKKGFFKANETKQAQSDLDKKTEAQLLLKGAINKLEKLKELL